MAKTITKKKKAVERVEEAHIAIFASFNNTIITASALSSGNVLAWTSSGVVGFKGAKKSTPFAATTAMKQLLEKLQEFGVQSVNITVSGAGNGRDAALRALSGSGIRIGRIKDSTPLPHNGCRPRKARRN